MPEMTSEGHRALAVETFNAAWDLVDSPVRTIAEEDRALQLAFASRYHWEQAGGGQEQLATGDWFIGHVAAHLGLADVALRFSARALDTALEAGFRGWALASAYEGMARANAVAGNRAERERYTTLAEEALSTEENPEEREVIEEQLRSIPD